MSQPTRSRPAAVLASISLSALVAGCATVGPDFTRPDAPASSGYAMQGDLAPTEARLDSASAAVGPWWNAFNSPALDAVIRQAIADSWPQSLDDSKASADWGWKAQIGIEQMVTDMLANVDVGQAAKAA